MKEDTPEKNKRELLDFCFKQGEKNFNFDLDCANTLEKNSNTTLSFIISFGGASLFGLVNYLAQDRYDIVTGLAGLILYFLGIAFLLVQKCLFARPISPPGNDPINLYQPDFSLTQIMDAEINQLEKRIQTNIERNKETGRWLNRVRYMIFLSPFIFLWALQFYQFFSSQSF